MAQEKFTQKPNKDFLTGSNRVASHALYIATVKATADSERMGRMVPPLMMKAIADAVYEIVLKPYKEIQNG